VTFRIGTDLNVAQMLTQNRVQDALPRLPEDVQLLGVQVRKATPSILLAIHLYSQDKSRDTLYLSNYLTLHVKDELARLQGVGDVQFQGGREYAMRVWLDPDKIAAHDLSASEVLAALRAQNLQVSAGVLNRPPVPVDRAYQINVEARGRLSTPEEFGDIVLKSDSQGRVTRVRDVGHAEVGATDYGNITGNRRALRNDRRDLLRASFHAGLLHIHPQAWPKGTNLVRGLRRDQRRRQARVCFTPDRRCVRKMTRK
jgi:multidrug efflux pump subunit AcrB